MKFDLKSLTRKELEKLAADVKKALLTAKARDRREAMKAAEKAAAEFGFSLNDLAKDKAPSVAAKPKKKKSKPAVARFANPEDPAQTWTGKGRQPFWFKNAVEAGTSPDDLAI
ncbi:H-NS family nucleoid-associated regulatory protein [Pseudosulfitobacter sp. SM2401]|jgi:DNA-binding protein H-NS|uniref:H-NS histone family protein n=1 Tax=Pseudosulfitobacter sp. SM2401 TaxID=3350098 RepID=UPI0036F2AC8C